MFSPNTDMKEIFLSKLLMQTKTKDVQEMTKRFPILVEMSHIQTGIRSVMTDKNEIKFLEYYDIPVSDFYKRMISILFHETVMTFFLFDLTEKASIEEIKKVFQYYTELEAKPRIIIILKDPSQTEEDQDRENLYRSNMDANHSFVRHSSMNPGNASSYTSLRNAASLSPEVAERMTLENDILLWARRQGVIWYHVNVHDEFNYTILNKQIMKLLSR